MTQYIVSKYDLCTNNDRRIIVFPAGDIGIQTIYIMRVIYAIQSVIIIYIHKFKYNII